MSPRLHQTAKNSGVQIKVRWQVWRKESREKSTSVPVTVRSELCGEESFRNTESSRWKIITRFRESSEIDHLDPAAEPAPSVRLVKLFMTLDLS